MLQLAAVLLRREATHQRQLVLQGGHAVSILVERVRKPTDNRSAQMFRIPPLAALPLHGDARGIADFDPDRARTGSIGPSTRLETMPSAPSRRVCANTTGLS